MRDAHHPFSFHITHHRLLLFSPGLCINLKRTKIKGPNKQSKQEFEGEPNFYAMPPIRPAVPTAMPTPPAGGAVATNGTENTAIAPQASPTTNMHIPSPAGIPTQHFQYSPYGYPPPSYMFPVPPNAQPYTAAQSPGPGDGQQQQQQVSLRPCIHIPFTATHLFGGQCPLLRRRLRLVHRHRQRPQTIHRHPRQKHKRVKRGKNNVLVTV